jgi:hypothetical protein
LWRRKNVSENIELIASENFTSRAVMEGKAACSRTVRVWKKHPEDAGHGGCEKCRYRGTTAIDRAKRLFGCEHVNVTAQRRASQYGGLFFGAETGRQDSRHESGTAAISRTAIRRISPVNFTRSPNTV